MPKPSDIRLRSVTLYFLPVQTRIPLKFGPETLTTVTCARARVEITNRGGRAAEGWGETPLSVQWVWPSPLPYEPRHTALQRFARLVAEAWAAFDTWGHPLEIGQDFITHRLPELRQSFNTSTSTLAEPLPLLAALACDSVVDQAIHDAYGNLLERPTYSTYGPEFLNRDLAAFLTPAADSRVRFQARYPSDYLEPRRTTPLRAWHLVGGLDLLDPTELTGREPQDGYPVLLADWIRTDGLRCLKVKLRGNDAAWDYSRLARVGQIALAHGVEWLSGDFNCTVTDPEYVNAILDRLRDEHPRIYGMLLYVEQPFPYDLETHRIDARSVAARKPLFLDESAHDWRHVELGRALGWSGVALKTCKTQTGALLSACWARAHGMTLMVQDLTNPMLAQIPHLLLAAHVRTIMGVETNCMQFYPDASNPEAAIHPGLYRRRQGNVDLTTLCETGFGYRVREIQRTLPAPDVHYG